MVLDLFQKICAERTGTNNVYSSGFQTVGCETQHDVWFIPTALLVETDQILSFPRLRLFSNVRFSW